ncbi:signal transduction histidine kinase [Nocardiopsis mwathae]|uniref:histidine kinase n=1 Tax=Nocardiopsis mwathae TaxID=1472723 RepID=A0A7W9YFV2_9ACTN|nr:histidine kinase [Nocardiopsis mwathae]MBB6171398.1 signal transduction histidine kinase [Nocardiopsis mwathae]
MEGPDPRPAHRRRLRDRCVDAALFACAVLFGLLVLLERSGPPPWPQWLVAVEYALGALSCLALWLRRRWPVALAVVLVVLASAIELVAGAALVALFTVAVHRPWRTTAAVAGLSVALGAVVVALHSGPVMPRALDELLGTSILLGLVGWGLFIRHRRQLVLSLRDRAERAETEARLRAEQAQLLAREQIAREMHDILGHRLSLLSVHAGALEFRPDARPEDIARTAGVIRESAHQALQDLREVIGVLRAPTEELPQPTFADVRGLVAESSRAGTPVELDEDITGTVPDTVGRTAYRIVQEALTNARKHAPGAPVHVALAGRPGEGLTVEVRNPLRGGGPRAGTPVPAGAPAAKAGHGLLGLAERAAIVGGRLRHGPTTSGDFRVEAWLPWPA